MSLFFAVTSAILAVLAAFEVVGLARGRASAVQTSRVVLPLAVATLVVQMALRHWSVEAFVLLAVVIVSAGALAVRGRGRDHAPTWVALGVFAAAGLAGGFGLLTQGLCVVGETYGCGGLGSDLLAAVGWTVAWAAYGYLAWNALRA